MAYNIVEKRNVIEQREFTGDREYFVILGIASDDNGNVWGITRPMKKKNLY